MLPCRDVHASSSWSASLLQRFLTLTLDLFLVVCPRCHPMHGSTHRPENSLASALWLLRYSQQWPAAGLCRLRSCSTFALKWFSHSPDILVVAALLAICVMPGISFTAKRSSDSHADISVIPWWQPVFFSEFCSSLVRWGASLLQRFRTLTLDLFLVVCPRCYRMHGSTHRPERSLASALWLLRYSEEWPAAGLFKMHPFSTFALTWFVSRSKARISSCQGQCVPCAKLQVRYAGVRCCGIKRSGSTISCLVSHLAFVSRGVHYPMHGSGSSGPN